MIMCKSLRQVVIYVPFVSYLSNHSQMDSIEFIIVIQLLLGHVFNFFYEMFSVFICCKITVWSLNFNN